MGRVEQEKNHNLPGFMVRLIKFAKSFDIVFFCMIEEIDLSGDLHNAVFHDLIMIFSDGIGS